MTNPYKILGTKTAEMRGRDSLFNDIIRHLTKATPDHISVVGSRHYGKTVILQHLSSHFVDPNDNYLTSVYWDLRHGTPSSDRQFLSSFASELKKAVQQIRPDYAEYVKADDEGIHELIDLMFDDLEGEGQRLLVIMDGFDHILASPAISRNLWDSMRTFAQHSSLRLVTGSRGRLRELCRSEESRTSDFWEIFYDTPLSVCHFEEDDWDGLLTPFFSRKISFDNSAMKELVNWSGGVPLLVAALLNEIWDSAKDGAVLSKSDVDTAAHRVLDKREELLETLWDDCSVDMQSDLVHLADAKEMPAGEMPEERYKALTDRGFIRKSANKIKAACRLVEHFAQSKAAGVANLRRLFGDKERFEQSIRALLEMRLTQIEGGDPELRGYVEKAIRDVHPSPKEAIVWARRIAEHALDLIWKAELPQNQTLPQDWISEWQHTGENLPRDTPRLSLRRGAQCGLLRLITGTDRSRRVAKYVTKPAYLLVDHIQSVGDFGQHIDENPVSLSFAVSFCFSAISLFDTLSRDLVDSGKA